MKRHCYFSLILPGKTDTIRQYWENKKKTQRCEPSKAAFWESLHVTGFHCWLQPSATGDFMIHSIEGKASLEDIFNVLRKEMHAKQPFAMHLRQYYLDVLGKDYSTQNAQPKLELLSDVCLEGLSQNNLVRKGYVYPLLSHKVEAHKKFRHAIMNEKKGFYKASLDAFKVKRLTTWLQETSNGHFVVVYSERLLDADDPKTRLELGKNSKEWQEISNILQEHTGLSEVQLTPQIEMLS